VFKDDALVEIASTKPQSEQDLGRSRLLLREARKGDIAAGIIKAVKDGLNTPADQAPKPDNIRAKLQVNPALADMLRVLLKATSDAENVAAKLIASSADLDALAAGERDIKTLKGWRREVFGEEALLLCAGKVGLAVDGQKVVTVTL
jgi:ribonuclease D